MDGGPSRSSSCSWGWGRHSGRLSLSVHLDEPMSSKYGSFNIISRANPFRSGAFFLSEERGAEFTAGKQRRRGRNSRKRIAGAKVV
eukprot:COSAG01_NODE_3431_length_6101_cov_12.483839_7_plen_85_part_01